MFTSNPFAELSADIPAAIIQVYVILMILCVVGGTLFDIIHKRSAQYFFENWRKSKGTGDREVGGGELGAIAVKTAVVDVATSGEFCNPRRRIAHLLSMYGFLLYVITTAIMVFGYADASTATPTLLPVLWNIGVILVMVGGYWFWFFIRVDVAAEGQSPFRLMRADLFILSLLASVTMAFIWEIAQAATGSSAVTMIFLGLYIISTTVLFGSVPWSKFSHMFFKPAAAFEKRMSEANGSRNNLPKPADRTNPEERDRHSMELLKDAPLDMGLGIKREAPKHY